MSHRLDGLYTSALLHGWALIATVDTDEKLDARAYWRKRARRDDVRIKTTNERVALHLDLKDFPRGLPPEHSRRAAAERELAVLLEIDSQ